MTMNTAVSDATAPPDRTPGSSRHGAPDAGQHPRHDHDAVAATFRAVGEPARLTIVHALADGEARVTDLVAAVGLAQSTTSAHVAVLRDAGLLLSRTAGRATYYRLATPALLSLVERAEELLEEGLHAVVHEHEEA